MVPLWVEIWTVSITVFLSVWQDAYNCGSLPNLCYTENFLTRKQSLLCAVWVQATELEAQWSRPSSKFSRKQCMNSLPSIARNAALNRTVVFSQWEMNYTGCMLSKACCLSVRVQNVI